MKSYLHISAFTRGQIVRDAILMRQQREHLAIERCLESATDNINCEIPLVEWPSYKVWFPEFNNREYYELMRQHGYNLKDDGYYIDKGDDDEHMKRNLIYLEHLYQKVINGEEIKLTIFL